ncbi:MAG TPA: hypothetical protein VMB20_08255, partial [Candidatus Acidoferrum sp.]|nr:hypothetical protein [Candidatus Acidoferrum sp.]
VTVQVMGNLTPSPATIPALNVGQSYTVNFSKTFDSEQLVLYAGGPCQGVITATPASGSFPATPSRTTANASLQIVGQSPGTCALVVQDQYGERVSFNVTVQQNAATWPQQLVLGALGNAVGLTSGAAPIALNKTTRLGVALGPVINALLGGGVARAYASAGQLCNALGVTNAFVWGDNPSNYIDRSLPASVSAALNVYVDSNGCLVDSYDNPLATVGMIAYNPAGTTATFETLNGYSTCNGNVATVGWQTSPTGVQAYYGARGNNAGTCNVGLAPSGDTATPAPDAGLIAVNVLTPSYFTVECTGFIDQEGDRGCGVACEGDSVGCQGAGQGIQFLCAGQTLATDSSGLFTITTGEGTSQPEYSIGPNQSEEVSTSSDGTAFIQSGSC